MSNNKMLIDASHPEETRVAVVRGNRIEEYDFESQEKRQLRGNIYLAKVTRVEPSLQAAFIDYGGNRHGFLAFSEIHPDYYQIPVADRQALLAEEAAEARANREEEEAEDNAREKKSSRGRGRGRRKKADTAQETEAAAETDADEDEAQVAAEAADESDAPEQEAAAETTEDDPAAVEDDAADNDDVGGNDDDADDDTGEDDGSKTVSAIVETDSISEPLPGDEDEPEASTEDSDGEAEAAAKPKRRTTRRKKPVAKKEKAAKEAKAEESEEATPEEAATEEDASGEEEKKAAAPKKRRTRSRSKKAAPEETSEEPESDAAADEDVESVGQEDALEEVPQRRRNRRQYKIQEVIKRRQVLLIQVVKEERGTKGAALTTYLSLAGRYSVLMPNTARGGGISRKITNSNDRKRLKEVAASLTVPEGMGVILRTAGASRTKAEIKRDFEYLMRLWEQVRNLTLSSSAPCLVYEEGSLIKRSIRDLYNKDIGEVLVAGDEGYKEAKDFMGMLMPSHAKNVKQYKDAQSIFAKHNVEAHLDRMLTPQVTLKSGGYLVINQTEALVAIDVNSGRSTREHSIEDTATRTNLEAAEEVARQLRLRDLAGLIVIDFIDMEEKRNNRAVEKKLKECLKNDRARIQVGRISHFGLLEMSRQRIRASVLESTMDQCPHCGGTGHVRSESAIALHIFRSVEEHLSRNNRHDVTVRTTPTIAINLLNQKRKALVDLEEHYGLKISIEADAEIKGQEFVIGKGQAAKGDGNAAGYGQQDRDTADNDNERSDDRPRGRGRRRRSRDEDGDDAVAATQNQEDRSQSQDGDGEDDDRQRKRRRRGKRGGRKNRGSAQADANAAETEDAIDSNSATDGDEAVEAATPEVAEAPSDAGAGEEKRTPRRGRRKPKEETQAATTEEQTVTEAVQAATDDHGDADTDDASGEDQSSGRQTRRPKKASVGAEGQETPVMVKSNVSSEADEEKAAPKKSGWWSRGSGFF